MDALQSWVQVLGAGPDVLRAGQDLLSRYAEPQRRYHDLRHLHEVLAALRALTDGAPAPAAVVLAAFCHDAVYDPERRDNEERSAVLAEAVLRRLGVAPADVEEVVRLVLLTAAHHPAPGDEHGALLCDADLAILGAAPERYRTYAADVRSEYSHLSDDAFRTGRAAVLRELLDRPRLFTTEPGRRRWDAPARWNLRAELERLGAAPPRGAG